MQAWRLSILLILGLLLEGCLVSFEERIAPGEEAPIPLIGEWSRRDGWGDALVLEVRQIGPGRYRAREYPEEAEDADEQQQVEFTVARHGRRWYLSARVPDDFGGGYAVLGFELTPQSELVLYSLEPAWMRQALEEGSLAGEPLATAQGPGVRIRSPLEQVFGYLDDPANSDVFSEVARYRRVGQ